MKITELHIEGFRSLKNVTWKPGDLNVIIGPNGSGKSNLLRMLELISAAAQGRLSPQIQTSGGIDAIVWDGQINVIRYLVAGSQIEGLDYNVGYQVAFKRLGKGGNFQVEREDFSSGDTAYVRQGQEAFVTEASKPEGAKITPEAVETEETLLPQVAAPIAGFRSIQLFHKQLINWPIYQNIRVDQQATIRLPTVTRVEKQVAADAQNLVNVLHTLYTGDRDFKHSVNTAMRAAFGDDFDELIFPPASDQRIQLRVRWKTLKREQSAADLSDGTLRFLFLITILASPSPPPLIAIDEPETGLHPSMLPIIAEYAVDAAERTQVIFTTHSDQFLDAFGETKPTTTVAKWENGETTLTTLNGDELDYWLKDYTLGNLFRSGELEAMAS